MDLHGIQYDRLLHHHGKINLENASKMLLTATAIFDEENRDEITGKEQI